ncbi:MAG: aspartyl/glutamyl-tRNA amidotransferase subunit C [Elusimicrobiaceae bacterium]|nr:aspartyl/glutamyl-tRNA amidotransferase subunit C [Elusimicrobiaceae bacterium]
MEITKKDVELAGKLAKMRISPEETAMHEAQLKSLFNWVDELSAVNTDNVTLSQTELAAFVRPDKPVSDRAQAEKLRQMFGSEEAGCAKVKKVL